MVWIDILSYVAAFLLIGIIIMVHELGHFWTGRALGFKIDEFAIGFGPKIAKWKSKKYDTVYSIRPIPIGGFTKYHGEDKEAVDEDSFSKKPVWRRFITIFSGPAFNIIFALILAVIFLSAFGEMAPAISNANAGAPAYKAGLRDGDRIVSVNGQRTDFLMEAVQSVSDLSTRGAKDVQIGVLRDGKEIVFTVPFQYDQELKKNIIGIVWNRDVRVHYNFFEAIGMSFKWIIYIIVQTIVTIGGLISGQVPTTQVGGFLQIITTASDVIKSNFESVLRFATLISISLAVFNFLPFPALDGGRMVFLGIEKIRRKPLPPEKEGYVHLAGFILLIALMILVTWQDIARLITG